MLKHLLEAIKPEKEDLIYWMFEIPSGFTVKTGGSYYKTSTSLRLTAIFDELCFKLFFKDNFKSSKRAR